MSAQAQKRKKQTGSSSRPVIRTKQTLSSFYAQRVYNRSYEFTSKNFHLLSVVLRAITSDENVCEVEAVIDNTLNELSERMNKEIERLKKQCSDNGIDPRPTFTDPVEIEVEIASPRAGRYLGLITHLDEIIGLISVLWLSGVRTDSQNSAECYQWQQNLIKASNRIKEITVRAVNAANKEKEEQQRLLAEKKAAKKQAAIEASKSEDGKVVSIDSKSESTDDAVKSEVEAEEAEQVDEPVEAKVEEADSSESEETLEAPKPKVAKKAVKKKATAKKDTTAAKTSAAG